MGLLATEWPLPDRHRLLQGAKSATTSRLETVQLGDSPRHQVSDPCRNGSLLIDGEMPDPAQGLLVQAQRDVGRHLRLLEQVHILRAALEKCNCGTERVITATHCPTTAAPNRARSRTPRRRGWPNRRPAPMRRRPGAAPRAPWPVRASARVAPAANP